MRTALLAILLIFLSACSPDLLEEKVLTAQERTLARAAVEDIGRGDSKSLNGRLAPELQQSRLPITAMRNELPAAPRELTLAQASGTVANGQRAANGVYIVKGKRGWAVAEISVLTRGGRPQLTGIYVQRTNGDPREANRLSLVNAGFAGWGMIAAMAAAVAVIVAALLRIWRSGLFTRRWLWTLGALIGLTTLRMNWGTGDVVFQPISFQLFSVSAIQTGMSPWTLGVSIPVVALIALLRRQKGEGAGSAA